MKKIALLHSTIRGEEKLLLKAAKSRGVSTVIIDLRKEILSPDKFKKSFDVAIERSVSTVLGMHAISFFESQNIPIINSSKVANICIDKFITSLALTKAKVPTIPFALTFDEELAKKAIHALGGYPVIIKPTSGSWGRLLAKINDDDALEAVLEQKKILGGPSHKAFYMQKYVEKKTDIRVTMAGNKVLCAISRDANHWIANTARGAEANNYELNPELIRVSKAASKAVGGGVLGIDVFETDEGYVVNEVNHTTEFKNVQRVTSIDVAGEIIEYAKSLLK